MKMPKVSFHQHWRLSHYATLVFVVFIFCAVNFIGYKRHFRDDLSTNRYLTLSEQTLNLLKNLPGTVTMTLFTAQEPDVLAELIQEDVENLLKEYAYRSKGKIQIRKADPFSNFEAAQEIAQKFKLTTSENVLVIEYGDQSRVLNLNDLAIVDTSGLYMGNYNEAPKVQAFKGEPEISGALMGLVQGKKFKVYFTTGHGEPDPMTPVGDLMGISILKDRVEGQNAEVLKLDIAEQGGIPQDADLVVILGAQYPFTEDEITRLNAYLQAKGKLFLFLEPRRKTGLENLLQSYGVVFEDNVVLRPVVALLATSELTQGVSMEAVGMSFAEHPAIEWISKTGSHLPLGVCRSLKFEEPKEGEKQNPAEVTALAQTSGKAWGETSYQNLKEQTPTFNPQADADGPLTLAAMVDTGAVQGGQVNLQGTRVLAVGGSSFLLNKYIGSLQADFFLNAMNWMLDRNESLGITAKIPKTFTLSLTEIQKRSLAVFVLILIPMLGVLAGVVIWFKRKR